MYEKEALIKERKLAEANTKNYKGLEGKFGIILKYLGKPIIGESEGIYSSTPYQDFYEEPEETMSTLDDCGMSKEFGKMFDGLKYGMHLEITYLDDHEEVIYHADGRSEVLSGNFLNVIYKGYKVYREVDGDLNCFVGGAWEQDIERLYALAVKNQRAIYPKEVEMARQEAKEEKLGFLERIRKKWGI